jgi:hypothetical protein
MTLVASWLVFPALLVVLALGWGLLVERVAGMPLPGALLPPIGLASIMVAVQLTAFSSSTARLSTPVVVLVAAVGVAVGARRRRLDPFAAGTAAAVFCVFAAPVALSGEATFAGYIKLDDTATWLALTEHVLAHGRDLSGLAPSSHQATVDFYLKQGYPVGSLLPLGASRPLVGQDLAWLFQPYLATLAAMLSLSLSALLAPLIKARGLRSLSAFIAGQSALLFGYALWGGVKELATAYLLALMAALVPSTIAVPRGARGMLPLALSSAAILATLNISGAVWLLPALVGAAAAVARPQRRSGDRGFRARHVVAFCALATLLSLPSLATASAFMKANSVLTDPSDLQNLLAPLRAIQLAGVWPSEDFRNPPSAMGLTYLLVLAVVVGAALGLLWAYQRRSFGLVLYVGAALTGWAATAYFGSPWVDAKALATASPALLLAGMVGAAGLWAAGRRLGVLLAAVIAAGVLWSNALAYHDVSLAPRARLSELQRIGERIAGQGPTLMTEYEPYGARYFLRDADPEGASDLRFRPVQLRTGRPLPKGAFADLDRFELSAVLAYRTLVLRNSPTESRPPAPYRLIEHGKYYEVWQRRAAARPVVLSHLPLGDSVQAGAEPPCTEVRQLAQAAKGSQAALAAAPRARSLVAVPAQAPHPRGWQADRAHPLLLYPEHAGSVQLKLQVVMPGRYAVWLGGSFGRGFDVSLDGKPIGAARFMLNNEGQYVRLGEVALGSGTHTAVLHYNHGDLRPGTSDRLRPLGPLVLSPVRPPETVRRLAPRDAGRLCGTRLDWIEVVRR